MEHSRGCSSSVEWGVSDPTVKEYCARCGTTIEGTPHITKTSSRVTKYFCCRTCYEKYLEFKHETQSTGDE
ncbi:MAG: TRASH domain-containing protein [Methanopyri archaeon]|nr:TRASH domain-containing protein [Methanopyri archaeon]